MSEQHHRSIVETLEHLSNNFDQVEGILEEKGLLDEQRTIISKYNDSSTAKIYPINDASGTPSYLVIRYDETAENFETWYETNKESAYTKAGITISETGLNADGISSPI